MRDERSRHLRQLRRLRSSLRRWSVTAAGLTTASAVVIPYQGLGPWDAIWAGLAGGTLVFAGWRWSEHRALSAQPVPDPVDPGPADDQWLSLIAQVPGGHAVAARVRRTRTRAALRGSAAADAWQRLDRAARSLREFTTRLPALDRDAAAEANRVEQRLRELTNRIVGLEEALRLAPEEACAPLAELRGEHTTQLESGVTAYEQFVVAAASHLSEAGRVAGADEDAIAGLNDATDRLRGVSEGLAELRRMDSRLSS